MFREMIRSKQLLSQEDSKAILERCTNGVLACMGDDDYPYAVPLSYVYYNDKIYFHGGRRGHKVDALERHDKVSFAVVDKDQIVPEEFTSYFRSVVLFGRARVAEGQEAFDAFMALTKKYSGTLAEEKRASEIRENTTAKVYAIDIDHMTGKEAIELVREGQ